MFKGKYSTIKNIVYLIILGLHGFFYSVFLYYTRFNILIFFLSYSSFVSLLSLAFYSFLASKKYFYHFYITIILSSLPFVFLLEYSELLIVPEFIILIILFFRGTEQSEKYLQIRVNKKASLYQHDPAILRYNTPALDILGLKMDLMWNPNGTLPIEAEKKSSDNINFNILISFVLGSIYFFCSVFAVIDYYDLFF